MTWDDVCDVLIDGTSEEMMKISCPECGGILKYVYDEIEQRAYFDVKCTSCGSMTNSFLGTIDFLPNCVELFGTENLMSKDTKFKQTA